jgi:hypothetical protein
MSDFDDSQFDDDDLLDNVLEEDGSEHFLYGEKRSPNSDPGKKSGCLGLILFLIIPLPLIYLLIHPP